MRKLYNTSINIKRDSNNNFDYLTTPNSDKIISELDYDFSIGIHSFNIIGSFGTGKSSFLIALQKHLLGEKKFNLLLPALSKNRYGFINIVSTYDTLHNNLLKSIDLKHRSNIYKALDEVLLIAQKKGETVVFLLDEFGKILEYASKNNPEKELYEIQTFVEYINDHNKNCLLITTLHQAFDNYSFGLNSKERNEWSKVKGRFKELAFNEPVEQLLFLAAKKISNHKTNLPDFTNLLKCINKSKAFQLKNLNDEVSKLLYPIDILAASTLVISLQRYGQNERSLFTFLNSRSFLINNKGNEYYGIVDVYNYLVENFSGFLFSKYNSDATNWNSIISAIQRIHSLFDDNTSSYEAVVKVIGLLTISGSKGSKINTNFLENYLGITCKIKNTKNIVTKLLQHKILRYLEYKDTLVLFEGTDVNIDEELMHAERNLLINSGSNDLLKKYIDLTPVLAKSHYFNYGVPRYFEYVISDKPISEPLKDEIDGYINLIINEKIKTSDLFNLYDEACKPILYCLVSHAEQIKKNILEIEKVNHVLNSINPNDLVATRELKNLKKYHIEGLNHYMENRMITDMQSTKWYYKGTSIKIHSRAHFNKIISEVCKENYPNTPIVRNELFNREKIPANISRARRDLLQQLFDHWEKNDIGFVPEKFPPEKTIYLSLLKQTGIHLANSDGVYLGRPTEKTMIPLWDKCEKFLGQTKSSKKSIKELIDQLMDRPFRLRKGFIEFWISIWLFIKRDDFALYGSNTLIPELSVDILDLILRNPEKFYVKTFDLGGIKLDLFNKYRELVNYETNVKMGNRAFIETIKPFLVLYRSLPEYSKKTNRLSSNSLHLRDAIINAKDLEHTFFEDFPNAFGMTSTELSKSPNKLMTYIKILKESVNEIRTSYSNLLNRIESSLMEEFDCQNSQFPKYKEVIQRRYQSIKKYAMLPYQKMIHQRIYSSLDDREAWLNSLTQGMTGKQLSNFEDEDEEVFYSKIQNIRYEFDNLNEFALINIDIEKEEAIKLEITSITDGLSSRLLRFPKNQNGKYQPIEKGIKNQLKNNISKNEKIFVLLKLLKEELNGE